jgi:hypothetical protein
MSRREQRCEFSRRVVVPDCVTDCRKALDSNRMLSVGTATGGNGRSGVRLPVGARDLLSPFSKTSGPPLGPKELRI